MYSENEVQIVLCERSTAFFMRRDITSRLCWCDYISAVQNADVGSVFVNQYSMSSITYFKIKFTKNSRVD